ncbi:MAG TPA: PSD1 and planctomycete cytochrome C domain-containing protein [Gemmataceae bacterium]|nr:PSD1 and planctomycete cytochrome C domain-containing protein [Gemmataceae bacterium]
MASLATRIGFLLSACMVCAQGEIARAGDSPADGAAFFEAKIRPVLVEHCYECHSAKAKKVRGGLRLDSRARLLSGGDRGPGLVPGDPDKSLLLEAVGYKNPDLQMPKGGKLSDAAIADLAAWVKMGAPWGKDDATAAASDKPIFDLLKRKKEHWAWKPIQRTDPPAVKDVSWPRDPVDRFILAKLEEKGLSPARAADKRTLLRRVSFDLTGLPPTPEEIDAFLKDDSPDAYEEVVDRLLASPQFGERWARHWLDLVRYAETRGHEFDYPIPDAYQYRDYVIRALNADVPYDQFVTEQIAGDLLEKPRLNPTDGFDEAILGTGFWFLGEEVHSPVDLSQDQADRFDNRIDVFGKTFLGLTIACARCHDHKFDAISQKDYYALFGLLESCNYRLVRFDSIEQNRAVERELAAARAKARPILGKAAADALRPTVDRMGDYLLAARECILAGPQKEPKSGSFTEAYRKRVALIAGARNLDAALLGKWIAALLDAARDPNDPLYTWAKVCGDAGCGDPKRLAEVLRPAPVNEDLPHDAESVVDYALNRSAEWMPDDTTFGLGPVLPGDIQIDGASAHPTVRLSTVGAAAYDRTWDGLKTADGSENDPGALGKMIRAGRTIRTPTFTVGADRVFFLVRGAGVVYAAVNSHVMIAGPLHGQLVADISASDHLHWASIDLTPYKGRRGHLEFTAAEGSDFAVARVVQSETQPGPVDHANRALLNLLSSDDAASLERLAAAYQRLFQESVKRLRADQLIGTPEAADLAALADCLLRRPELLPQDGVTAMQDAAAAALTEQKQVAAKIRRESRLAVAMQDGDGVDEHVFKRGSYKTPGDEAPRRFLEALAGPNPITTGGGSGRLELARQMTDPALDPFLPRVMVNRIWAHLFGRGIVASVDNFGALGEAPTHPELLDYLADQFVRDGWSIKKTIRKLVLSSAYRMSSHPTLADEADPQNLLLHRMRLRRLEGEAIRDAMLSVSGRLDLKMHGPSVPVHLTPFLEGRGKPADGPLDGDGRRSLYIAVHRNFLSPTMLAFDTPSPFSTVGRRTVSNVPAQALILMNDSFVHQQAELWAKRINAQGGSDRQRIQRMYLGAFGRPATDAELSACFDFLETQAKTAGKQAEDPAVWADLAHTLFQVKEFIWLD